MSVWDIRKHRVVLTTKGGTFNPTETLYFNCIMDTSSGGWQARIYNVPNFTLKTDLLAHIDVFNAYQGMDCSQNVTTNQYQFIFAAIPGTEKLPAEEIPLDPPIIHKTYTFNLLTGVLENVSD